MKRALLFTIFLLVGSAFVVAQDTGDKWKTDNKSQLPGSRRPLTSTKSHKGGKKGSKGAKTDLGDGSVRAASGKNSLNPQPLPPGLHAPDAQTQGGSRAKTRKTVGKKGSKVSTDVSTSGTQMKPGGPGVPPPTRPTDPK